MSMPSTSDFLDAAQSAYSPDPGASSHLAFLTSANGLALTATRPNDGFHAVAFETGAGQVIVAFEGTDLGSRQTRPVFGAAQIEADRQIYEGESPALYADALRFTRRALAVASAQGIAADDVFVAGHSLGGAQAEYVAAKTGLAGVTFGAPGIPVDDIPPGATSRLVDYVDYGDPVGNYSADSGRLGHVLASDAILRFGAATYVGQRSDAAALTAAGRLFGTSSLGSATSLGLLADAANDHHRLEHYAADLGETLPGGGSDASGVSAGDVAAAVSAILGL